MNPALEERLRQVSARVTKTTTGRFGNELGIWYGCGFPKSGTVWLCGLMGSYLYAPFPQNYLMPVLMRSVVHAHWEYDPKRARCIYITRDGRDVMVSYYFHWLNQFRSGRSPSYAKDRHTKLLARIPKGTDIEDAKAVLPHFMQLEFEDPRGVRTNWNDHVTQWVGGGDKPNVSMVRYEGLLADGPGELAPALEKFDGPVDMERLKLVFELLKFERRKEQDTFFRKGVAGDWRNHFTEESVEIFKAAAQRGLEVAGYETDSSWGMDE